MVSAPSVDDGEEIVFVDLQNLAGHIKYGFLHVDPGNASQIPRTRSKSCPSIYSTTALFARSVHAEPDFPDRVRDANFDSATTHAQKSCYSEISTTLTMSDISAVSEHSGDEIVGVFAGSDAFYPNTRSAKDTLNWLAANDEGHISGCATHRNRVDAPSEFVGQQNCPGCNGVAGSRPDGEQWLATDPHQVTSVMLKNIPCRCSRAEVLAAIESVGFGTTYPLNFFYLPTKSSHQQNIGYAFIGFQDASVTAYFSKVMTGFQFPGRNSAKCCEVVPARIQGMHKTVHHFSTTRATHSKGKPIFGRIKNELPAPVVEAPRRHYRDYRMSA